jgi:hypothetical protein
LRLIVPAVEAQEWIAQHYTSLGLKVSVEAFRKDYSSNVIAELPGYGDASKVVIIGAHYDSRALSLSVRPFLLPFEGHQALHTALLTLRSLRLRRHTERQLTRPRCG